MSDFRVKLLALTAFGTLFAGMSYGQAISCPGVAPTINPSSPILVRAESEADLVSDVSFSCPSSGLVTNGQLTVFLSLPVTSKAVTGLTTTGSFIANGNSEALLSITDVGAGGTIVYQGTVAGSVVTFNNVKFPANFTATISNIRVNASGAAVGSTPVAITETIFAGTNGLATYTPAAQTVGYALKSLANPALTVNAFNLPAITNIAACTGNSAAIFAPAVNFTVLIGETFGGFFKTQTGGGVIQNGEQGSMQNGASSAIGTAASGTQISLTFGNVPSAATVYLPTSITYTPAGGVPTTLTIAPVQNAVTTGGASLIPLTTTYAGNTYTFGGFAGFTPSSGSITVTYLVTASSQAQIETFAVPVYVAVAANAAAPQGAITVLEAYAPATAITGLASSIPVFAPTTNTAINAATVTTCQTSLLYPFVTNQLGFDTGVVIANTSTDNLGTGGASIARAQAGTCTLSFYGTGAPTPATGVADPGGNLPTASTHAFLLSSVAPGFQGYMIAQCPFQFAHGFGFLAYNLTQNNGAVEGYIAEVLGTRNSATQTASTAAEPITF